MRDFKNPTYDGPDCVCCKSKADRERERITEVLEAEKARTKLGFIQYRRIEELIQPEVRSDAD